MPLTLSDGAGPSPLLDFESAVDIFEQDRAGRVGEEALDPTLALVLEVPRHARKRTSGTCGASKGVEVTAPSLCPDLRARRVDVCLAIGDVVELVRPHGVLERGGVPGSLVVIVLGIIECDG